MFLYQGPYSIFKLEKGFGHFLSKYMYLFSLHEINVFYHSIACTYVHILNEKGFNQYQITSCKGMELIIVDNQSFSLPQFNVELYQCVSPCHYSFEYWLFLMTK